MPKAERTLFPPRVPMWQAKALIARLGGVGPVAEKLMAKGFSPPSQDTIQGWSTRNSIPGAWSPAVFGLALEEGLIRTPMELVLSETK